MYLESVVRNLCACTLWLALCARNLYDHELYWAW